MEWLEICRAILARGILLAVIVCLCMLALACLASPRPEAIVHQSPAASVVLERLPERSIRATHPVSLDPVVLAAVLRGVHIQDDRTPVQALFASEPALHPAFSEEDIQFLTPLVRQALAQATAAQQIRFRVSHPARTRSKRSGAGVGSSVPPLAEAETETTEATLYAQDSRLHFTLTQYRHQPERPDTIHGPNRQPPDPTGLNGREVVFIPEAARRLDGASQSTLLGPPDLTTLVIDLELLKTLSRSRLEASSPPPAQPSEALPAPTPSPNPHLNAPDASVDRPAMTEEVQSLKDLVIKKDMELEVLKKEMQSLRRQLAEREAQIEGLKKKTKPAPNIQEPVP